MTARPFTLGDPITVVTETGRRLPATVGVTSPHFGAMILEVPDGMISGWLGRVPVFFVNDGWETLDGVPIQVLPRHDDEP